MDMKSMLAKAEDRYKQAYNFGSVEVYLEPSGARAKLIDFSESKENCIGWTGALEAMLEMTNTKGTVEEVDCRCEGGECCEFIITWEK